MTEATNAASRFRVRPGAALSVLCVVALALGACGDAGAPPAIPQTGGTSGTGGVTGTGGVAGSGGTSGTGGTVGTGGAGGQAGMSGQGGVGTGGSGGSAGTGGTGGVVPGCATNALCHTCPSATCNVDTDCPFDGSICVPSGCTFDGVPQKECQPPRGGSCTDVGDCPDGTNYECKSVAGSPPRCVRTTPGCSGPTEAYDCAPGFSCEGGTCVDRRAPCDDFTDCPKNHVCANPPTTSTNRFCVRVFRTCHEDSDCSGFGRYCADIDGDGRFECAGELGSSGAACVNDDCAGTSAPVCEASGTGTTAFCSDHGLCESDGDCDTVGGFVCRALAQDGRKECVSGTPSCDASNVCPIQQVCAAPRNGDPPSCQAGTAP